VLLRILPFLVIPAVFALAFLLAFWAEKRIREGKDGWV
jgi:hypothetical protein